MHKAILFDLGGTLWDDQPAQLMLWEILAGVLEHHGIRASIDTIRKQAHAVIKTFSPSLTRAIAFRLVGGNLTTYWDVMNEVAGRMQEHFMDDSEFTKLNPLYAGVHSTLKDLCGKYRLGVVSQHFAHAGRYIAAHGLDHYFTYSAISGKEKLFKPDPRLFLTATNALRTEPQETMMVGDRLDNDIWPANRLRMTTVRVLSEPYRHQQPRYHTDVPDYSIHSITELPAIVDKS